MKTWYIYAHITEDTNELFYIGVGTGNRAWSLGKSHRNSIHVHITDKYGCKVDILFKGYTNRDEAVRKEVELQELHKPRACIQYGDSHSQEMPHSTRAKLSKAGRKRSKDRRQRLYEKSRAYNTPISQNTPYRRISGDEGNLYHMTTQKTCSQCYKDLEEKAFTPHKDFQDGLDSACRACRALGRKTYTPLMQEAYRKEHYIYGKKKCTKCKEELELKLFSKRLRHRDGLSYVCRPCAKDINVPYVPVKKEKTEVIKKRVLFSM